MAFSGSGIDQGLTGPHLIAGKHARLTGDVRRTPAGRRGTSFAESLLRLRLATSASGNAVFIAQGTCQQIFLRGASAELNLGAGYVGQGLSAHHRAAGNLANLLTGNTITLAGSTGRIDLTSAPGALVNASSILVQGTVGRSTLTGRAAVLAANDTFVAHSTGSVLHLRGFSGRLVTAIAGGTAAARQRKVTRESVSIVQPDSRTTHVVSETRRRAIL